MELKTVEIHEVGPREGFQFEGIGDPDKISTEQKAELVDALSETGVPEIQVTSFVSPRHVPQMADAEALSAKINRKPRVRYTALYLNDKGLERAEKAGIYELKGRISFTASQTFSIRNQNRDDQADEAMQRRMVQMFLDRKIRVDMGSMMAVFGCNYEGDIPLSRVIDLVAKMHRIGEEFGIELSELSLADTMGWADPEAIKRTLGAIRERWPDLEILLHLHDTRGAGLANAYAAMEMGIRKFDTSVGGLGGCPFAGTVAGNIATEDLVFMCERMGVSTGIDLAAMVDVAKLAERIVGHSLPSKMAHIDV